MNGLLRLRINTLRHDIARNAVRRVDGWIMDRTEGWLMKQTAHGTLTVMSWVFFFEVLLYFSRLWLL